MRLFSLIPILLSCLLCTAEPVEIDFGKTVGEGSPYVFGGTQPRGLSDQQWDLLKRDGFTFVRSQADVTRLVPCDSPEEYLAGKNGCADPANWDWEDGIYGDNFAGRAIERGMRVCLVYKNALWNRYPGAPKDEETMPKNLEVWEDVLRKIINHYQGDVQYIEIYNEVDRDPQFRVEGSGYTRKTGYLAVMKHAINAVKTSKYPETFVGGPASALVGEKPIQWMLEDDAIRPHLDMITFHDFDAEEYPEESVDIIQSLMKKYGVDLPIVRSSFVPEFNRTGGKPGSIDPIYVGPHIIGALKDGLEACGLWEIQNKSGDDDPRYWFDGDTIVPTANFYRMLSNTLGLGKGTSNVVESSGSFTHTLGALNTKGQAVVVLINPTEKEIQLRLQGLPWENETVEVEMYRGDFVGDGKKPVHTKQQKLQNGKLELTLVAEGNSIYGLLLKPVQ